MALDLPDIWFPDQEGNTPKVTLADGTVIPACEASGPVFYYPVAKPVDEAQLPLIARIIGGAKEVINQLVATNEAMKAEWFQSQGIMVYRDAETGKKLSGEDITARFEQGQQFVMVDGEAQQVGATAVRNHQATATAIASTTAVLSRGRSLLRDSDDAVRYIADQIKKATTDTRSVTEAMGKAGMQQAKERLNIKTDPRYVDRYHGPDDIGLDANKRLTEIEAKGSYTSNTSVSKNVNKEKQSSSAKNLRRAETMTSPRKIKKLGQLSNRQGGSYTLIESDLWEEIKDNNGDKRHLSTHTNIETGQVRVLERDRGGNATNDATESFKMDYFDDIKNGIESFFNK